MIVNHASNLVPASKATNVPTTTVVSVTIDAAVRGLEARVQTGFIRVGMLAMWPVGMEVFRLPFPVMPPHAFGTYAVAVRCTRAPRPKAPLCRARRRSCLPAGRWSSGLPPLSSPPPPTSSTARPRVLPTMSVTTALPHPAGASAIMSSVHLMRRDAAAGCHALHQRDDQIFGNLSWSFETAAAEAVQLVLRHMVRDSRYTSRWSLGPPSPFPHAESRHGWGVCLHVCMYDRASPPVWPSISPAASPGRPSFNCYR